MKLHSVNCLTTEEAVLRHAAELRDRLIGPEPDALVQLVAERVVLSWIALTFFETQYVRQMDKLLIAHQKFFLARIELANKNLLSAARTLAKVRRTKLPKVLALVNVSPPAEPAEELPGKAG